MAPLRHPGAAAHMALAPALLWLLLLPQASALPLPQGPAFAVMLDAGSGGTRVRIYSWPSGADCRSRIASRAMAELGAGLRAAPGLATRNAGGVARYLAPLLEYAAGVVPDGAHPSTPIYLQATAGMRLLPAAEQAELLGAAREALRASPFASGAGSARVISGGEEAANEWTAVNYLRGSLLPPPRRAAVLGMGGASTQIAFVPAAGTALQAGAFPVALQGLPPIELYVHSYLGLGLTEARLAQQRHLAAASVSAAGAVDDPCLLRNRSATRPVGPGDTEVLVRGGGDWAACAATIERSLINASAPCPLAPCAFNGVYQPSLAGGQLLVRRSVFEISGFVFTASFFALPQNATLAQLEAAGRAFCALDWQAARSQHPGTPERYLGEYCFQAAFFTALLRGYGVERSVAALHWADEVDDVKLDVTLGAVLRASCAATASPQAVGSSEPWYRDPRLLLLVVLLPFAARLFGDYGCGRAAARRCERRGKYTEVDGSAEAEEGQQQHGGGQEGSDGDGGTEEVSVLDSSVPALPGTPQREQEEGQRAGLTPTRRAKPAVDRSGFTGESVTEAGSSWAAARRANGLSRWSAAGLGAARLLVCHLLQPVGYLWVFCLALPALRFEQRLLGWAVAAREGLYLLCILGCARANPAFLLVDVHASVDSSGSSGWFRGGNDNADSFWVSLLRESQGLIVRTGGRFLVLYALAPEKFVASALLKAGGVESHGLWVSRKIVAGILGCALQRCCSESLAGRCACCAAAACWTSAGWVRWAPAWPPRTFRSPLRCAL